MTQRVGVYPGSFDPVTFGHLNILERAKLFVDHLIVAVVRNPGKNPMFPAQRRMELIRECIGDCDGVSVVSFDGLLIDFVRSQQADFIVRGLRAVSDFDYEFQMAVQNRHLAPEVDTLFMMTDKNHFYVSSRMVKEIWRLNGDVSHMVNDVVLNALNEEISRT